MEKIEIGFPEDIQQRFDEKERPRRKIEIEVPTYSRQYGAWPVSEMDYLLDIQIEPTDNSVVITADKGGLISLARHLLTLAQDEVPAGCHIHYDGNLLEEDSCALIVDKTNRTAFEQHQRSQGKG